MERRTFHTLDALRGLAAICVVFWHADYIVAPLRPQHGALAVDLFFIMSGFVIAHAYEAKLRAGLGARAFTALRLIRLYPLYALGSALGLAAACAGFGEPVVATSAAWTAAMLPTPSLVHGVSLYPYDGVAWSLLLEVFINVVYACTWRMWTIRNLVVVAAVSAALLCAATVLHGDANFGWTWRNLPGGLARVSFGFPMGVLIYRLYMRGHLPRRSSFGLVMGAALVLLYWRPESHPFVVDLVGLLVLAPLVVVFAVAANPSPPAVRIAAPLGAASYAIYALHAPLLEILRGLVPVDTLAAWSPYIGLAFAAAVAALALAADAVFDAPVRAWLMRRNAGSERERHRRAAHGH